MIIILNLTTQWVTLLTYFSVFRAAQFAVAFITHSHRCVVAKMREREATFGAVVAEYPATGPAVMLRGREGGRGDWMEGGRRREKREREGGGGIGERGWSKRRREEKREGQRERETFQPYISLMHNSRCVCVCVCVYVCLCMNQVTYFRSTPFS